MQTARESMVTWNLGRRTPPHLVVKADGCRMKL
ncbi:hypothetical protein STVIR_2579 [Streptomyces viridochromogenes Tue57]|uniref:Uncharacterized protein n=1 Tax=Streptomyces viridochromogenes Tue57 TaxID=1160705 RepID=L8PFZ6_STRVR|nr:hypothetical protein STVIR_2579 [Streptomyces viridochromogenes Tue57]